MSGKDQFKWGLVTGGMRGIGLDVALALAESGVAVIVHDLDDQGRRGEVEGALLAAGAPSVRFDYFDLLDSVLTAERFAELASGLRVDIVVNNAGLQAPAPLVAMERSVWDRLLAVNLSAAFESLRAFLPGMCERGFGRVVNIASVHGLVGSANKAAYVAAKHGLIGLTKAAALECSQFGSAETGGVTINAVCPGWTETALIEPQIEAAAAAQGGDRAAGVEALLAAKQPTKRFTTPAEVGAVVKLIVSPSMHNMTGSVITIDGGWTAQ